MLLLVGEQTQGTVQRNVMVVMQQWMTGLRSRGYQLVQRSAPSGVVTLIGICIERPCIMISIKVVVVSVRSRRVVVMMGVVELVVVVVVQMLLTIEVVM